MSIGVHIKCQCLFLHVKCKLLGADFLLDHRVHLFREVLTIRATL